VVAASRDLAGVKIQVPFFLRFGEPGVVLLRRCVERWHEHGCAVVLDAKVGDADDTMAAWADFYLGPDSLLAGDAVTANAYMGFGTVDPLLRHAMARACGVLVMVRTSNHAAADVQQAIGSDGRGVAVALADAVTAWNLAQAPQEPVGPAGAVVGARLPESAELVDRLGRSVIEVPGLGRADRDTGEVLAPVRGLLDRTIVTVTTGVLRHGPGVTALRSSLDEWRTAVSG
jgi:orotidine-5'-phosphate decarboxylase